jgi:hypothetical protein
VGRPWQAYRNSPFTTDTRESYINCCFRAIARTKRQDPSARGLCVASFKAASSRFDTFRLSARPYGVSLIMSITSFHNIALLGVIRSLYLIMPGLTSYPGNRQPWIQDPHCPQQCRLHCNGSPEKGLHKYPQRSSKKPQSRSEQRVRPHFHIQRPRCRRLRHAIPPPCN